jgi:hypothetical protein
VYQEEPARDKREWEGDNHDERAEKVKG